MAANKVVGWAVAVLILALIAIPINAQYQHKKIVKSFEAYGSSGKEDAVLASDFAACLKMTAPLESADPYMECGRSMLQKHGAASFYQIDKVWKTL